MRSQREEPSEYQSYLLRLWRTHSAGETVWRATLEEPLTQEVVRFDSLQGLFSFLQARTGPDRQGARPDGLIPPPRGS